MSAYTITTLRPGVKLNHRTMRMLADVERRLGHKLSITQGSYNPGKVSASAGVHDGGGAVDVAPTAHPDRIVLAMRRSGFAAWHRPRIEGLWPEHVHAVAIGDRDMSPEAARQVIAYRAGRNGLANNKPDDGPRVKIRVWELVRRVVAVRLATADLAKWRREHAA